MADFHQLDLALCMLAGHYSFLEWLVRHFILEDRDYHCLVHWANAFIVSKVHLFSWYFTYTMSYDMTLFNLWNISIDICVVCKNINILSWQLTCVLFILSSSWFLPSITTHDINLQPPKTSIWYSIYFVAVFGWVHLKVWQIVFLSVELWSRSWQSQPLINAAASHFPTITEQGLSRFHRFHSARHLFNHGGQ